VAIAKWTGLNSVARSHHKVAHGVAQLFGGGIEMVRGAGGKCAILPAPSEIVVPQNVSDICAVINRAALVWCAVCVATFPCTVGTAAVIPAISVSSPTAGWAAVVARKASCRAG